MNITSQEYYFQVQAITRELFETATVEHGYRDVEEVRENLYENLMDALSEHEFIIYHGKALDVLHHTRNEDAYFERNLPQLNAESFGGAITQMAVWAFYADCWEHFESCIEDWMEELSDNE